MTHIDRSIVGIILTSRVVTPRREPVAAVKEIVTATDQLHTGVMRMIPTRVVPFRVIRTEYFVVRTLPAIASFNPMVLVESNRWNLLRFWLRAKVRVLRFDLLHLLRSRLLRLGFRISLHVLLDACRSWRSCTGFSQGGLPTFPLLDLLLLPDLRRHSCRTTGNIRSRRGSICRFLMSPTLPAFSCTALSRHFTGRFSGDVRLWGVHRSVARVSFLALFRARLVHSRVLIRRAAFLHRSGLLRWLFLRRSGVWAALWLSRVRFFRGALAL